MTPKTRALCKNTKAGTKHHVKRRAAQLALHDALLGSRKAKPKIQWASSEHGKFRFMKRKQITANKKISQAYSSFRNQIWCLILRLIHRLDKCSEQQCSCKVIPKGTHQTNQPVDRMSAVLLVMKYLRCF